MRRLILSALFVSCCLLGDANGLRAADEPVGNVPNSGTHTYVGTTTINASAFAVAATGDGDAKKDKEKEKSTATVAVLKLKGNYPEGPTQAGLFGELEVNLRELTRRLDSAAKDDKIAAVILEIREPTLGRGKVNELRAAIARVRKSGKKVYADIDSPTGGDYLLATACDKVVMPPAGMFLVTGVRAEVSFFKGLFDKIGVKADMLQIGSFKGAAEPLTRENMSPDFRKNLEGVVDDFYEQMVATIAADRKLEPKQVKALLDEGIFSADRAKEVGLIDMVAYDDQLRAAIAKDLGKAETTLVRDYGKKKVDADFSGIAGLMKLMRLITGVEPTPSGGKKSKIAVIYVVGVINTGENSSGLFEAGGAGSDTIIKALRDAQADEKVKGIVLRVDSPGGSGLASDLMWREIVTSKKPIVASMGDTAASGGYYVSMGCKKIFVEPGTLTGSIGVVGGKVSVKGLLDTVGVHFDVVSRGKNSGWMSVTDSFTPDEKQAWTKLMKEFYHQFVSKAAQGRKLDPADLEKLAEGRVFSGKRAVENHLADAVGTLDDAVVETKKLAGLKADDDVEIETLPKPKNFFEQLFGGPSVDSRIHNAAPQVFDALGEASSMLKLFAEPNVAIMPYGITIK